MVELVAGPVRKTATGRARKAAEAVGRGRYVIRCGALAVEVDGQFHDETLRRLLQVVVGC
jgi:Ni,Fe-hydrogenase III small subunit